MSLVIVFIATSILISSLDVLLYCNAHEQYKIVHIDQRNNISDCKVCTQQNYHNGTTPCQSYSELDSCCITSLTKVVIHDAYWNLSSILTLENLYNLTIAGANSSSNTVIHCKTGENAGLEIKNVTGLSISNVSIQNCGALYRSSSVSADRSPLNLRAALYIEYCTDVHLFHVKLLNNNGIGLVMYNTRGKVLVWKSLFKHNSVVGENGGGGMFIELNSKHYSSHSRYILDECTFSSNKALTEQSYFASGEFRAFGQGGGLLVSPQENATNNTFIITNCVFYNNTAVWGGGLHLFLARSHYNYRNLINISNTTFDSNLSLQGGGGLTVYYYMNTSKHQWVYVHVHKCVCVHIHKCNFTSNEAKHGGGTLVVLLTSNKKQKVGKIIFQDCLWKNNRAIFSSAVDLTGSQVYSGLVDLVFFDSKFISNKVYPVSSTIYDDFGTPAVKTLYGNSAFMLTFGHVLFKGYVVFIGNNGTALLISTAVARFYPNTIATFMDNAGVRGGAISLLSSSYLWVGENCTFSFTSNKATVRGGAIYSSTIGQHELHEHIEALGCFIRVANDNANNITFTFSNNKADYRNINYGNSIFASSLLSCASSCSGDHTNISAHDALSCIAKFKFMNSTAETEVSSSGSEFSLKGTLPLVVIPGKEFELPIVVTDTLKNIVHSTLRTYVKSTSNNSNLTIDIAYTYISEKNMKLYGLPGEHGYLILERVGYRTLVMSFEITLDECPPGFVIGSPPNEKMVVNLCVCASNHNQSYTGLEKCSEFEFQAFILHGYWAGYNGDNASEDALLTAHCPLNFCTYNSTKMQYHYKLPSIANKSFLNEFICNKNRTGILCGSCIEHHSVYFHSPNYICGPNKNCSIGSVLYIVSELLPLVILFSLVLIFNIKFTSGKYNGFIFFAQVVDYIAIDASDVSSILDSKWIRNFNSVSFSIYRIFNLNFFSFDSLSFCLWNGAKMLDIIIFKFATISFAFFLVLVVYLLLNVRNFYRVCRARRRPVSVIHGLSTFLVMCYAQCVQISFRILTARHLFGKGGQSFQSRVLYSGDTVFFSKTHVVYAIPALVCIVVVVIIPTILLLWYPCGQRLLGYCRISETKYINILQKLIPIHRMQPFFDSFQGCFNDKFRFFAGLYLAYRFCILACDVFSVSHAQFYLMVEVLFIIILLLHSMAQPYVKRWHNVTDSLLFSILALINASSVFLYVLSTGARFMKWIYAVSVFRSFLIALPLIGMVIFLSVRIFLWLKHYIHKMHLKSRSASELDEFPARLLDEFNDDIGNLSYQRLKKHA